MKLLLTCLAGLAAAAPDTAVFHDEAPTRAPQKSFDHDWEKHQDDAVKLGEHASEFTPWTYAPSKFPTPAPTHLPTATPTQIPTATPTRDSTRIIKTCTEVGSPDEVVWYSGDTNTICSGKITQESCPSARRCLLEKTEEGSTYTSTCSHIHCKVSIDSSGRKITKVKHHHAEKYGSMHICQQGLHKDYGHADHCGCECFDELAGDNDWLTGLAHRNLQTILSDPNYVAPTKKYLRVHQRVDDRKYLGHASLGGEGEQWAKDADGNGVAPTSHEDKADHSGYSNHEGVTMFGYNN